MQRWSREMQNNEIDNTPQANDCTETSDAEKGDTDPRANRRLDG